MTEGVDEIAAFILESGLTTSDLTALVAGAAERLSARGVPLWRMHIAVPTINPVIRGRNHVWMRDGSAIVEAVDHDNFEKAFAQSPYLGMVRDGVAVRRWRLSRLGDAAPYPILERFRLAGATEYLAHFRAFGGAPAALPGIAVSFGTDAPVGFTERDTATLGSLVPAVAVAAARIALLDATVDVLSSYVGRDAGRRVLEGRMRRGRGHRRLNALLVADLRGFTSAAEAGSESLLARLGEHLDAMVEPVEALGGQVLKFMGDGVLAAFAADEDRTPASACSAALAAACEAVRRNDIVNGRREGEVRLGLGVALHLGEAFYGNIGAGSRLDFTVIGPAVNEVSRIERLCGELGRSILMSRPFALACGRPTISLGRYRLRGVADEREIFAPIGE